MYFQLDTTRKYQGNTFWPVFLVDPNTDQKTKTAESTVHSTQRKKITYVISLYELHNDSSDKWKHGLVLYNI